MKSDLYVEDNSEYLKNNPSWHTEDSPWKAQQIIKLIKRNKLTPKSVVEVGCGAGEILNQLHAQMPADVKFVGYEISPDAYQMALQRKKDRLDFKNEDLFQSETKFDLLLMIDVFEHVEDYFGFIRETKKIADHHIFHIPLDISALSVLRGKFPEFRQTVGHIHSFTKETALATLKDCGFEVIDHFYTPSAVDLSRTLKSKIAKIPRILLAKINNTFASRLLGGFSLIVYAKPI